MRTRLRFIVLSHKCYRKQAAVLVLEWLKSFTVNLEGGEFELFFFWTECMKPFNIAGLY